MRHGLGACLMLALLTGTGCPNLNPFGGKDSKKPESTVVGDPSFAPTLTASSNNVASGAIPRTTKKRKPNAPVDPNAVAAAEEKAVADAQESKLLRAEMEYEDALAAIKNKNYAVAESHLRRAIQLDETDERFWNDLGRVQYWRQDYGGALGSYQETLRILRSVEPADRQEREMLNTVTARVHTNLGDLYREWNRPADALDAYGEATRRNPKLVRLHCEIASQYIKLGDYRKAEDHYNTVLSNAQPQSDLALKAHIGLAVVYHLTDRHMKAYEQVTIVERQQYRVDPGLRGSIMRSLEEDRSRMGASSNRGGSDWRTD